MDYISSDKLRLLYILMVSAGVFAYLKYFKKGKDFGIYFFGAGVVNLSIFSISAAMAYPPERVIDFILLKGYAPVLGKFIIVAHCSLLTGVMSLLDTGVEKLFQKSK